MSPERKFYVYVHRRKTDGRIFYVGKGSKRRAWYFKDRFEWWTRIHKKHGTKVEICQDHLSEDQAYLLEMWLIAKLRHHGVELANFTDGGDAPPKWFGKDHPMYKSEIIRLVHSKTGEKFEGTRYEFLIKCQPVSTGNFSSFTNGRQKSFKGWIFEGTDPKSLDRTGENHWAHDPKVYDLENKDGRTFSGTRYDFAKAFNLRDLDVNAMLRRAKGSVRGWFPAGERDNLPKGNIGKFNNHHDPQIYRFEHKDGGVFVGTGYDLCVTHGATASGVHCLKIGRYETHAGWRIAGVGA